MKDYWLRFLIFKSLILKHKKQVKTAGFTLVELLVVIIIIGILAAIALPSFLSQASRANESEGKQNIKAINEAQQAEFAEVGRFGTLGQLELGLTVNENGCTQYYCYTSAPGRAANGFADVVTTAVPTEASANAVAMAGRVWFKVNEDGNPIPQALACQANQGATPPNLDEATACPNGSRPIGR